MRSSVGDIKPPVGDAYVPRVTGGAHWTGERAKGVVLRGVPRAAVRRRSGRVALCTDSGPQIVPVNYSVVEDSIVFRTTPYSVLGTYAWKTRLAFEVDHIDYEQRQGGASWRLARA